MEQDLELLFPERSRVKIFEPFGEESLEGLAIASAPTLDHWRKATIATWFLLACVLMTPRFAGAAAQDSSSGLTVTGSISKGKVRASESLQFWITAKNQSSVGMKSLRLIQYPEAEYSICVVEPASGRCSALTTGSDLIQDLAPSQTYTLWGEMKPKSVHSTEKLILVVGWVSPSGNRSFAAVPLGDCRVQSAWDYHWDLWISDAIKTLAVPAVLALLAFTLDWLLKRREDRVHEREKQRENTIHEQEKQEEKREAAQAKEQAVATETWKQMLPISHEYAAKFYLPLSSAAEDAIDTLEDSDLEAAFFYALLLLRRIDLAKETIGGLYFKSLAGEQLAQACWRNFRNGFFGRNTEEFFLEMHRSSKALDARGDFEAFKAKFLDGTASAHNPQIMRSQELFKARTKNNKDQTITTALLNLKGFSAILDFEVNRPYEHWYNQQPKLQATKEVAELLEKLALEMKLEDGEVYFKSLVITG